MNPNRNAISTVREIIVTAVLVGLFLGGSGLAVTVWGGFWLAQSLHEGQLLNAGHQQAPAIIVNLRESRSSKSTSYYVTYHYTVLGADGRETVFEAERSIRRADYEAWHTGQKITILYAVQDPHVSRLASEGMPGWVSDLEAAIPLGVGGLMLLGTLWFAGYEWKQYQLARELDESGIVGQGRITRCWFRRAKSTTYYVAYEFSGGYGATQSISRRVYNQVSEGQAVPVRYLPRDPNISRMEFPG